MFRNTVLFFASLVVPVIRDQQEKGTWALTRAGLAISGIFLVHRCSYPVRLLGEIEQIFAESHKGHRFSRACEKKSASGSRAEAAALPCLLPYLTLPLGVTEKRCQGLARRKERDEQPHDCE